MAIYYYPKLAHLSGRDPALSFNLDTTFAPLENDSYESREQQTRQHAWMDAWQESQQCQPKINVLWTLEIISPYNFMMWNVNFRVLHDRDVYVLIWIQAKGGEGRRERSMTFFPLLRCSSWQTEAWVLRNKSVQSIPTFYHLIWSLPHDQKWITELKAEHLHHSRTQYWSTAFEGLSSLQAYIHCSIAEKQPYPTL